MCSFDGVNRSSKAGPFIKARTMQMSPITSIISRGILESVLVSFLFFLMSELTFLLCNMYFYYNIVQVGKQTFLGVDI